MEALAAEQLELAWLNGVRALQLSPETAHLWVNLGAIYRFAGQHRQAESSYLFALQLDPWDRSAMNNLVVLYGIEGRAQDRDYWEVQVARYRDENPYYHAWLGDQAAEAQDWQAALQYYEEALALLPDDSRLLYAAGISHYQLDELATASTYIKRAIKTATLRSDIENYQLQLEAVQRKQLAGI
jgi:Flp pilus assembly protein TadD